MPLQHKDHTQNQPSACVQSLLVYLACTAQCSKTPSRCQALSEVQRKNHVFLTSEVKESQQLDSVIQQLASQGCKGAEPGAAIHCRGQVQQDVTQTIAQVHITPGCTISLAGPDSAARYPSPAALSLHHVPPSPDNDHTVCAASPI